MKKGFFLLLLLPFASMAQYDFDSRYFTITSESLPEVNELTTSSFTLENAPILVKKVKTFQMNAENYREPVEMAAVVNDNQRFIQRKVDVAPIQQKFMAFGSIQPNPVGSSAVKNIAYKEVRGLDLLDPCPPVGICPRCAPYRIGRGY